MTILPLIHFFASVAVALALLTWAGNRLCKALLDWSGLSRARLRAGEVGAGEGGAEQGGGEPESPRVGRLIGHLERLLIAGGLLIGAWEVMAAVVALKTVARFKDLDQKLNAEYFLVGSLFSVGWAVLVTRVWIAYDRVFGLDVLGALGRAG